MHRQHEMIDSPSLGRKVHLWKFGHWGAPLMVFPSAAGFAHEWDAQGMIAALAPMINSGKLKVYCPESNIAQSWSAKNDPAERARQHQRYERFIMSTLTPWIRMDCNSGSVPIAATGCSMGGYFAANFALKYPEVFHYALCMSGRYNVTHFTDGFSNLDIYFNNPLAYVPNLHGEQLERTRSHTHLTLVCGQGAYEEGCIEETIALGRLLQEKRIPNFIDIWGRESRHDWDWWRQQAIKHLTKVFG